MRISQVSSISWPTISNLIAPLLASLGVNVIGLAGFRAVRSALTTLVRGATESVDAERLGEADRLGRFRKHFATMIKDLKRPVLVIIDDVDRCEPDYVVELVRGILTIFKSPRVVFLLLGDRNWIESSFEKANSEMAGAYAEDNGSFGGRFTEKAIQLSFILPEPGVSHRDEYIDRLLNVDASLTEPDTSPEGTDAVPTSQLHAFEEKARKQIRDAQSADDRRAALASVRESAANEFGNTGRASQAANNIINHEAVLRAASSRKAVADISHSIGNFKRGLPDNPRRIKRIINMIAAYQASGQAVLNIDPRTERWRQLVLWIILVSEHPAAWRILSQRPDLADRVARETEEPKAASQNGDNNSTDIDPDQALLETLRSDKVPGIVSGEIMETDAVKLDTEAVLRLRRLTPLS